MKVKFALIIFFTTTIFCTNILGQSFNKKIPETSIDNIIQSKMYQAGIVGIGAAIIINKKLVWTNGYGYADKAAKVPFTASTIMNIASISKTFTGVCIMKAVEEGKVSLDEDINNYLPFKVINPNSPSEKITLRHLATHTSSITDRQAVYESAYYYGGSIPEPLGEFLKSYFIKDGKNYAKENFLNAKPGTIREYSNIGTGLAGYIIELRTGKTLNEYAKKNIFKPLKMRNSGWALNEVDIAKHSKLYEKKGDSIGQIQLYEVTTYPDGGVRTSVQELSKFFISLLNNGQYKKTRILKEETVEEMLRFHYTETNKPENVKLNMVNQGIFWATKLGATRIGHNGSDPGVRTFMLSDLNKEFAVIVFFNTSLGEKGEDIFFDIYEELYKYAKDLKMKQTNSR
ncbi:MAG: beta-lactamase family protein [Algoriphagus sp.]|nr:beta-lactamase family protein [Algoriphagus sp.]